MSSNARARDEGADQIIHPRPSSIVAALYTLRDLEADVVIIHGPSGCCFKHSRLLEEDGIRVVTTAMDETNFVFGGDKALTRVIQRAVELFKPGLLGVIGSCASMIIGENIHEAVLDANPPCPAIEVEIHAGYRDNTYGAIVTLQAAVDAGVLDAGEYHRQRELLVKATDLEKIAGVASKEYIAPSRGDLKYATAKDLLERLEHNEKGVVVLNAKKETAYQFADILVALSAIATDLDNDYFTTFANLDPGVGLPRLRKHAENILSDIKESGAVIDHITGGLDEYPITGINAGETIKRRYRDFDFAVLLGVPHAVPIRSLSKKTIFSVTNGPRQVVPLKQLGHTHVTVEIDLHPKTLGVSHVVPSELGDTLKAVYRETHAKEG
ncbi:MAG TPA: Ni-sirohydrochlorin a,c-diamide reductive cyclase catalytic subunit [Candidatus Bathyarchaeia archaeon]|nr:Ni-sirohydrochlorin a,c-diamide reductive cyclase catalytic subunit [Candidatus Bathyarchaeia archaeon]